MTSLNMWGSYPILGNDFVIHLTPIDAHLFVGEEGAHIQVSASLAAILCKCTGMHTIDQVLGGVLTEDNSDNDVAVDRLALLLRIITLIDRGHLTLSEKPVLQPPRVTGSLKAYIPPHMVIELTTGCNLACRHCYRNSTPSELGDVLPTERLLAILDHLAMVGLTSVELTGGEPLLHPDFETVFDFCVRRFRMVGILTNGTCVNDDFVQKLSFHKDKILISISLDGSNPDSHDRRRGRSGAFERTVSAIRRLADAGIRVRVSMSVDEGNFEDIEPTLLRARELGASQFSYSPVLPLGRAQETISSCWKLDPLTVMRREKELAEKYAGFLATFSDETTETLENFGNCGAGYRTYALDPHGNVRPCTTYDESEGVIGNLARQSAMEVFSHPLAAAFAGLPVPNRTICHGCPQELFCQFCSKRGLMIAKQMNTNCHWSRQTEVSLWAQLMAEQGSGQDSAT